MSQARKGQIALGTLLTILGTGIGVAVINITGFFDVYAKVGKQDTEIATTKLEVATIKESIKEIKDLNYLILQELSPSALYKFKQQSLKVTSTTIR